MGIEPTSEAWEAYFKRENALIGGIFAFFDVAQLDSNWSSEIESYVESTHRDD